MVSVEPASPVVLLHGQPGGGSDWREVIARLPATVECLAADRPGYRSNPRPAAGLVGNAEAVLADLDHAGIDRAVLVGHSYGGGVALTTAALARTQLAVTCHQRSWRSRRRRRRQRRGAR